MHINRFKNKIQFALETPKTQTLGKMAEVISMKKKYTQENENWTGNKRNSRYIGHCHEICRKPSIDKLSN